MLIARCRAVCRLGKKRAERSERIATTQISSIRVNALSVLNPLRKEPALNIPP